MLGELKPEGPKRPLNPPFRKSGATPPVVLIPEECPTQGRVAPTKQKRHNLSIRLFTTGIYSARAPSSPEAGLS